MLATNFSNLDVPDKARGKQHLDLSCQMSFFRVVTTKRIYNKLSHTNVKEIQGEKKNCLKRVLTKTYEFPIMSILVSFPPNTLIIKSFRQNVVKYLFQIECTGTMYESTGHRCEIIGPRCESNGP